MTQPNTQAPVDDLDTKIEALIENSDGRWTDGEFRIDGPALSALLSAALASQPAQAETAPEGESERLRLLALHEAVAALYFDDGSKFKNALGAVVRCLDPMLAFDLLCNPKKAYDKACAMLATPPQAQPAPVAVDEGFPAEGFEIWQAALQSARSGQPSDDDIAAAVRHLYSSTTAAEMGRADDIATVRAVLERFPGAARSGQDGGDAGGEVPRINANALLCDIMDVIERAWAAGFKAPRHAEGVHGLWKSARAMQIIEKHLTTPQPAAVSAEVDGPKPSDLAEILRQAHDESLDGRHAESRGMVLDVARALEEGELRAAPAATVQGAGQAVGEDVERDAARYRFIKAQTWSVDPESVVGGSPKGFTPGYDMVIARWTLNLYCLYGMGRSDTGDENYCEDDLDKAVDECMADAALAAPPTQQGDSNG